MTRTQQKIFSGFFLALIYCVPFAQAVAEFSRGHWPRFLEIFTAAPTRQNLRAYDKQLEEDSLVAQAVRPWMQYSQFRLLGDAGEKVLLGRDGWLFYRPDLRYLLEPAEAEDPQRAILDFRDQLARQGIHLLMLPVPGKPTLYADRLTWRVNGDPIYSPTRGLISRLRSAGVEAVDLFALFERLRTRAHPYYLLRDTHWSGEAARIAAEFTAARLENLGWISLGDSRYTVRSLLVARRSDIARMTRAPLIEASFSPERVDCEQVVDAATGLPYHDDPDSPVLVLGDSFLRMYQTDEPRSAGFIAHLARALRRPVASVVNDGGASTLVRQELARRAQLLRGKKIVVWEFVERDIRFGMEGWQRVPITPEPSRNP
jgi:hypothetical protein